MVRLVGRPGGAGGAAMEGRVLTRAGMGAVGSGNLAGPVPGRFLATLARALHLPAPSRGSENCTYVAFAALAP